MAITRSKRAFCMLAVGSFVAACLTIGYLFLPTYAPRFTARYSPFDHHVYEVWKYGKDRELVSQCEVALLTPKATGVLGEIAQDFLCEEEPDLVKKYAALYVKIDPRFDCLPETLRFNSRSVRSELDERGYNNAQLDFLGSFFVANKTASIPWSVFRAGLMANDDEITRKYISVAGRVHFDQAEIDELLRSQDEACVLAVLMACCHRGYYSEKLVRWCAGKISLETSASIAFGSLLYAVHNGFYPRKKTVEALLKSDDKQMANFAMSLLLFHYHLGVNDDFIREQFTNYVNARSSNTNFKYHLVLKGVSGRKVRSLIMDSAAKITGKEMALTEKSVYALKSEGLLVLFLDARDGKVPDVLIDTINNLLISEELKVLVV